MKLLTTVLHILVTIQPTLAFSTDVQEYVLRTIEYLASVESGVFSCVFYGIAPQDPFDNDLNTILQSPRLEHIVKYVLNVTYHEGLANMVSEPSLLIIQPGNDSDHLVTYKKNIINLLSLFKPKTEVLVLMDVFSQALVHEICTSINMVKYTFSVYFESTTMLAAFCNGIGCWEWPKPPHPMYLFRFGRRWLQGRNISYVGNEYFSFAWNRLWLNEVTQYLNTASEELKHNCTGLGVGFHKCMETIGNYDIIFNTVWLTHMSNLEIKNLCTSLPIFMRILVPRDRPLNALELMLMPFSWEAWSLILAILFLIEAVKLLFPQHFTNDPFLLAVCGFERHDLHRAGRWEKTIFLALIILMFFMSNAFETKIVSLMTSKPSIQRIKTLADLFESDIKFRYDLEKRPHIADFLVVGKLVVQGEELEWGEAVPGIGTIWISEWVELIEEITYDFERMQPFYVPLDYESFDGPECYETDYRFVFADIFRTMHSRLVEAGLMKLWKCQWSDETRSKYIGRRSREDVRKKADLSFDDMEPAWIALGIGIGISLIGLLGEHFKKRFDARWLFKTVRQYMHTWKFKP